MDRSLPCPFPRRRALAALGGAVVLLFVPHTIHPLAWAALIASFAVAARSTVANFHRLR